MFGSLFLWWANFLYFLQRTTGCHIYFYHSILWIISPLFAKKYRFSVLVGFSICTGDPFLNPLHKQEPGVLNEKSYFPHAPQSGARKEKASLFSMSQASVFRANELQRSQQSFVSGVSFPKQVSRPPAPRTGLRWFGPSAPQGAVGAHTGWKNKAGTLKKRLFWKGRLGWGVEETC